MEPPRKPDISECCNSGCDPCILDVYQRKLEEFQKGGNQKQNYSNSENCIKETEFTKFILTGRDKHTPNSCLLTFKYSRQLENNHIEESSSILEKTPMVDNIETENLCLYYKPGQYFVIKGLNSNEDKEFSRAYTPIPIENDSHPKNSLEFTILLKIYEFGLMSQFLLRLVMNSVTLWRGPYGDFDVNNRYEGITHRIFMAQGSGIAPIYSVIKNLLSDESCEDFLKLYYCCKSSDEIFLRDQIYELKSHWNFTYEIYLSQKFDEDFKPRYSEIVYDHKLDPQTVISEHFGDKNKDKVQIILSGSEIYEQTVKTSLADLGFRHFHLF